MAKRVRWLSELQAHDTFDAVSYDPDFEQEIALGFMSTATGSLPLVEALTPLDGHASALTQFSAPNAPSAGTPVLWKSATQVNVSTLDNLSDSQIVSLATGGYLVVWVNDGPAKEIAGQRFDSVGDKIGNQFRIVSAPGGNPIIQPTVTALPDGGAEVSYSVNVTGEYSLGTARLDPSMTVISNGWESVAPASINYLLFNPSNITLRTEQLSLPTPGM